MSAFDLAVSAVLKHEGGYVDHPADPGGATNRGVTLKVLEAYRGKPVTKDDVRALTEAEARAIYRHRYWMPIRGDDLPGSVAYCVFDAAVNSGVSQASKWLQRSVGAKDDGIIGPGTLALAGKVDAARLVAKFCDTRLAFLKTLKTWPTFGKGWERRVHEVEEAALRLVKA